MRAFLSSTYADLTEHRRAVTAALTRLGLTLSRMEDYGARPADATSACFDEIEQSDLFVGVYAHRYGFVPSGSEISITEAEFNHAASLRRPTFCFVVDDEAIWPHELYEEGHGQALLAAFKARVDTLVVRDTFTTPDVLATRVAASVGRYLIADPRRHGARAAAKFARLAAADTTAALFVDVMRLASVASSGAARAADETRYGEFVDIADSHLAELRTSIPRLNPDDDLDLTQQFSAVERSISYLLVRLRRTPTLDRPWPAFARVLHEAAERVALFAATAESAYNAERAVEVAAIIATGLEGLPPDALRRSPDLFLRTRFTIQAHVLAAVRERGGFSVATVRDDIDRRLALPYFFIDLALLRRATETPLTP
ncbi:MAG: DUF4062 domain-containing protein [Vicinamibacterales bacterium]